MFIPASLSQLHIIFIFHDWFPFQKPFRWILGISLDITSIRMISKYIRSVGITSPMSCQEWYTRKVVTWWNIVLNGQFRVLNSQRCRIKRLKVPFRSFAVSTLDLRVYDTYVGRCWKGFIQQKPCTNILWAFFKLFTSLSTFRTLKVLRGSTDTIQANLQ